MEYWVQEPLIIFFVEPRTVDVHISRLRLAIERDKEKPKYILTIRGIGYKVTDSR